MMGDYLVWTVVVVRAGRGGRPRMIGGGPGGGMRWRLREEWGGIVGRRRR